MSRIAVIGTGYVGLTTGACFAHLGHSVVCADVIPEKVEMLSRGEVPILEAGLDDLVRQGLEGGRLGFVLGAAVAARDAEFAYLCVPTPQLPDGSADLSYITAAATEIGPVLPSEAVVVNKSTVPVGSTRVVERALGRDDVAVVSNPEFLREGSAVHDFLHPDRIVIGSDDSAAAIRVASLFENIQAPLIVTDPASAETIKYASNAFLAAKVSFVNAIANVCEAVGADVREVLLGMGYDRRIGFEFLKPGPGWGGSCLLGDESVVVEREGRVALVTMSELSAAACASGVDGWRVLAWRPDRPAPELLPVAVVTARHYSGDVVTVRTKMGRRVTTTVDHPFVIGDGRRPDPVGVTLAGDLTTADWLPVAQGDPGADAIAPFYGNPLDGLGPAGIDRAEVIVRLDPAQLAEVRERRQELPWRRRRDILRTGALRLTELDALGIPPDGGSFSTVTNGRYIPDYIPMDEGFWRMVGLYLAEGHMGRDGRRERVCWSFNHAETDLAGAVSGYWEDLGVRADVRRLTTALQVSVSSRILAAWFRHVLGVGDSCYDKRVPDPVWTSGEDAKRALLRGLWDGDGSWSLVRGGPSVVLEYGTVSRRLADALVRLLGDLRVMARVKVGRTAKSTVDTYWIVVSGAENVESALFLLPPAERDVVRGHLAGQSKRIAPTGHRPLLKSATWVRVDRVERRPYDGPVYSVEVPDAGTLVTSFGLVVHNCFPKDTRALINIAKQADYDFSLLKGVIDVNSEQHARIADKVERMAGGSVEGATVAVWGLTFKARTDDMRDSPALEVIRRLHDKGARVQAYDPAVHQPVEGVDVRSDPYAACEGAVVLVVLTEWDEFRWLDFAKVRETLSAPAIVDARNLLDPAALRRRGFTYEGVGRP